MYIIKGVYCITQDHPISVIKKNLISLLAYLRKTFFSIFKENSAWQK